ncbi:MAG: hypothetical protein K9M55_02050 [Candidatus Marinimicrobia bacterium]|nr:hypothetical protein [Candidatus Neomarinimicrobiota bacterium]MCF7921461.1 hypothetical protein [Candidatus Neomarinimicrobiota bacterium]
MIVRSFMDKYKLMILAVALIANVADGQTWSGDTLRINPITFNDPSPIGWNAQYKTIVKFPEDNIQWSKILMVQTLKCDSATAGDAYPCGEWDYIWNTFIKVPRNDTLEIFTLGSFVTPYGKRLKLGGATGWEWVYDITEYAPLLTGERELITGNNQELLNLQFVFIKGMPAREVLSVENVYPYGEYKYEYLATDSLLKEKHIILSAEAKAFRLKAIISGHGHAGPFNCCEWDSKTHTYRLNGWETYRWNVWKDCGNNPIFPQGGTWPFDRAGWCPGTKVDEYEFELTPKVSPGDTITLDYSIEPFRDSGEKDGTFRMSHQLFSYGPPKFRYDVAVAEILVPNSEDQFSRLNPSSGNPRIVISNQGQFSISDLTIKYGINGSRKKKVFWKGNLNFLESEEVTLPALSWKKMREPGIFEVEIELPTDIKDEDLSNNILVSNYVNPRTLPREFILSIKTNNLGRAAENRLYIKDVTGMVWYYQDEFKDSTNYRLPIELSRGSYELKFIDDMQDGISIHWWNRNDAPEQVGINGQVQIESLNGDTLMTFPSDYGQELLLNFVVE